MDHIVHRNDSDFYHSQSQFQSNMNAMSFDNTSTPIITSNSSMTPVNLGSSSSPNVNRIRPMSQIDEKWKKSTSNDSTGWKTSSSQVKKSVESWKMSAKPRHAQLPQVNESSFKRHSAMPDMMSTGIRTKPLPQEPIMPLSEPFNINLPTNNDINNNSPAPFHLNTPSQPPAFILPNHFQDFSTPIQSHMPQPLMNNNYSSPYIANEMMYTSTSHVDYPPQMMHNSSYQMLDNFQQQQQPIHNLEYQQQQQPIYNNNPLPVVNDSSIYNLPTITPSLSTPISSQEQQLSPPKNSKPTSKDDKDKQKPKKAEKRQITVQSINPEHRVWIDVLPNETGKSLAEKIHIIATFRTRKVVSITSASGRKIPIDNRPVFGNWVDMEKFEDGEKWAVEWRANDKSVVDRFFSKVVQGK